MAERKQQQHPTPRHSTASQRRPVPQRGVQYKQNNKQPAITKGEVKVSQKQTKFLFAVICMVAVTTICTIILGGLVVTHVHNIFSSRREYADLRNLMPPVESASPMDTEEVIVPQIRKISAFDQSMRQINPEYICWLSIKGTMIDYPVVRTLDNEKYLNVSFSGEESELGALFMDYRCVGETVPHIIIYGHNTTDGDMFGGLRHLLDEQYLADKSTISLRINDRAVEYEIFAARKSNVNDPAYYLDFSQSGSFASFAERCGAPADASQIITLSTCVSGLDKDERVIVQGVLKI